MLKSFTRKNLDRLIKVTDRYWWYIRRYRKDEIVNKHIVLSAQVKISNTLMDLEYLVENFNKESIRDLIYLFALTDWFIACIDVLCKEYQFQIRNCKKGEEQSIYSKPQREIINYYKYLRSLAHAHPFETNQHPKYDGGGIKMCEDLRPYSGMFSILHPGEDADYLMMLNKKTTGAIIMIEPIRLKDISKTLYVCIRKINELSWFLENKINEMKEERSN